MYSIKKSATIISLLLISGTAFYLFDNALSDKQKNRNIAGLGGISDRLSSNEKSSDKSNNAEQQIRLTPSIILRKKSANITTETIQLADINMPKSLKNTNPSSLIHIDADNQLILNHDIKVLFDYFFSADGDLTTAELIASMQQYIQYAYPQPAAQQALALLDKYLGYKQQMQDFHAQSTALQDLPELNTLTDSGRHTEKSNTLLTIETLMQERQDMREQVFTLAETDAMFGKGMNYDQYMLTVAKLDNNLSAQERKLQIEYIAQQHLTTQQQEARKQTFILQDSPPNFSIDDNGECQGDSQAFTPQQITALCQLAEKRRARSSFSS
ncbi:lipase secretion chaperone [Moritella sp. F3]|uniref:lipase secretion chaperone n=1 Tax=Moritella sp. F3 TaxID=2718882 RepID=UPI0018E1B1DC|nr:lipase secretion chaperone [Moritella sp. F3]GIC77318.1 hypothetical protein FMO001_20450 [Moritella sp. F1]GIC83154.1 hypothetical protein FMO003_34340 [Moritella sp. F3]